jgi:hypothetical protein
VSAHDNLTLLPLNELSASLANVPADPGVNMRIAFDSE